MQAVDHHGVKVYDLCVGKTLPKWLTGKQRRSLKRDEAYQRRIELVQDFHFNAASGRVKMTNDGTYIIATGVYPPQVKVFDTRELSMKFERHLDAEVVQFEVLSDDFTKLAFLGVDRSLEFHAAYGSHHRVRVPTFGRDLAYDPFGCELYVGAAAPEVYRLDLEQGTFLAPFETEHDGGVNVTAFSQPLQLLACGGDDGSVSLWDTRARKRVGQLGADKVLGAAGAAGAVTALCPEPTSGLVMAVGSSGGRVSIFDIRSSRPMQVKEHPNELPIRSVQFQQPGRLVMSADPKAIKLWNRDTGASFANIEPQADINDAVLVDTGSKGASNTSGLIMAAGEMQRVMSFYVPRLGQAPKWVSFLDNLTEELEQESRSTTDVYENYKFVQQSDLEKLGVTNLVGTPLLRAYMHGYFMDMRLYRRLKAVSEPLAFKEWRKSQVQAKMDAKHGQRIVRKKAPAPKVNQAFAERVEEGAAGSGATDNRFSAMFEDEDFEIDQQSREFKQLYPSGFSGKLRTTRRDDEADEDSEEEAEKAPAKKKRKSAAPVVTALDETATASRDLLSSSAAAAAKSGASAVKTKKKKTKPSKTMEEALQAEDRSGEVRMLAGGNMEATFVPKASASPAGGAKGSAKGSAKKRGTSKRGTSKRGAP